MRTVLILIMLYLVINENSLSASTLFAALVHKYKRGIIVGRETGSGYYHMNAGKFAVVRLPNSELELTVPLIQEIFVTKPDQSIPWGRGVVPDHTVPVSYDEVLFSKDPILDYTLKLIRK